ncbi:hypothetical protein FHS03_001218 [Massilia violacea]|uniref:Uncharacterized protein n=1 Tax=Pseudoduganella violacea TaxID=1715466 RepID=A0A7W5B7W7_9BURK|nr:hypothetical protein [Pseudoduganella violacea]
MHAKDLMKRTHALPQRGAVAYSPANSAAALADHKALS